MKRLIGTVIISVFLALAASPLPASAAKTFRGEAVKQSGDNVYLFEGSSQDVRKEFCLNDVIPVYRDVFHGYTFRGSYGRIASLEQVASIKVLSHVDDRHFNAQVVDGSVKVGDVAKKEGVYCPVSPGM